MRNVGTSYKDYVRTAKGSGPNSLLSVSWRLRAFGFKVEGVKGRVFRLSRPQRRPRVPRLFPEAGVLLIYLPYTIVLIIRKDP